MMRRRLLIALAAICFNVAAASGADAQASASPPQQSTQRTPAVVGQAADASKLNDAEAKLARESRAAILAAGLSAPYFDKHFQLVSVVNAPGDRRVVWKFKVGEHEAMLNDSVGFYTDERGRRVDTHAVAGTLPAAHEIERTITRAQAERIMKSCIGNFDGGGVVYAARGNPPSGALIFTASAVAPVSSKARREREERREREKRAARSRRKIG
ncbi:MAG: hypothetical protein LC754_19650, partial [Acidobacteria bacterium]|nr:hypothetical protein [Acidobacteriota bacterium]